jgi:hypothetical protein
MMKLYLNATKLLLFASLQVLLLTSKARKDKHSTVASISFPRVRRTIDSDECADSSGRFQITYPAFGKKNKRSCKWVAAKKTESRCTLPGVKDKCPVTCGGCIQLIDADDATCLYQSKYLKLQLLFTCNLDSILL